MASDNHETAPALADKYGRMIFSTAYRILGRIEDAEDALQEVFLRLLTQREGAGAEQAVKDWGAYLRVAATRCALDLLRRRSAHDEQRGQLHDGIEDASATDPRRAASARERAALLRNAMKSLPERDAQVFCLRYFEDLSYEEIGEQMALSASLVGVILHQSRRRLREILEPIVGQPRPTAVGANQSFSVKTKKGD